MIYYSEFVLRPGTYTINFKVYLKSIFKSSKEFKNFKLMNGLLFSIERRWINQIL